MVSSAGLLPAPSAASADGAPKAATHSQTPAIAGRVLVREGYVCHWGVSERILGKSL